MARSPPRQLPAPPLRALALFVLLCLAWPAAASSTVRDGDTLAEHVDATVAYWPREAEATLSHARDAGGIVRISTSGRGLFGTFSATMDAPTKLAWVPPVKTESSTFERYVAQSPRLFAVHSVGLHLQVTLSPEISVDAFANATIQDTIEANVRQILHDEVFHSEGSLPAFQRGFLAKNLCKYQNWRSGNPLHEALESESVSTSLCYSAAFSFPDAGAAASLPLKSRLPAFASSSVDSSNGDAASPSVIEQYFQRKLVDFEVKKRLIHVTIGRRDDSTFEVDVLEAWIVDDGDATKSILWKADQSSTEATTRHIVVSSTPQLQGGKHSIAYSVIQSGSVTKGSQNLESYDTKRFPASANVSIVGEGFHRRVALSVDIQGMEECEREMTKLLLRVPISHEVYADLDELRRMERFGELQLLAFTKHIEIERPSPVSPQHTIALAFPMSPSSSGRVQVDFPIHFRYQAPSSTDLYRPASLVAPELFLNCPRRQQHPTERSTASPEDIQDVYFQRWILVSSDKEHTIGAAGRRSGEEEDSAATWQRLSLQYPVDVRDVSTPVGFLPNGPLVSLATLSVASLGALLLVFIAVTSPKKKATNIENASTNAPCLSNWKPKQL